MLIGPNGTLNKAVEAKFKTEITALKEKAYLYVLGMQAYEEDITLINARCRKFRAMGL